MRINDDLEGMIVLYSGTVDYGGVVERIALQGWRVPEQPAQSFMIEDRRIFTKLAIREKGYKVEVFDPIADMMRGPLKPFERGETDHSSPNVTDEGD